MALEGKELEGTVGSINGQPIVKYSLDLDDHGIVSVDVTVGIKIDLLEKAEELLAKTSLGQKVVDFLDKLKNK